jgi:orotate phosphoribosyltransferase
VLLVDVVVTTGGSIHTARDIVRAEAGSTVVGAVTLVDRGEQAAPKFAELGIPYFPMATYADLGIVPVGGAAAAR